MKVEAWARGPGEVGQVGKDLLFRKGKELGDF